MVETQNVSPNLCAEFPKRPSRASDRTHAASWEVSDHRFARGSNSPGTSWTVGIQQHRIAWPHLMVWKPYTGWWLTYPSENYDLVSWDDCFHILWKIKHVPNHQPVIFVTLQSGAF